MSQQVFDKYLFSILVQLPEVFIILITLTLSFLDICDLQNKIHVYLYKMISKNDQ